MRSSESTISLADLQRLGIRLHASEAAAIARDVTVRAEQGLLPGIPSADVLRFAPDGSIRIEGPVAAGRSVERAARLLDSLLPPLDQPSDVRVPGALRLVLARALATLDLPAYRSLEDFASALARFAAADTSVAVTGLVTRAQRDSVRETSPRPTAAPVVTDSDLTISDVRRARRATGLTLTEIAERSRIPVSLLRELEWGYFINWPSGYYGRSQLVRYARAAGLDEQVVVQAVWPVLETSARARPVPVVDGTVLADDAPSTSLVRMQPAGMPEIAAPVRRRPPAFVAAAAIAALLGVGALPAIWTSRGSQDAPADPVVTTQRPATDGVPAGTSTAAPVNGTSGAVQDRAAEDDAKTTPQAETRAARAAAPVEAAADPVRTESTDRSTAALAPVSDSPSRVTPDTAFSPAFATAGSAMFYHSAASGRSDIMRADTTAAGTVLRVTSIVNDNASNFHARPSPDGEWIAFDSDREGERAVFIADANGRNVRRITGPGFAAVPSWSPDGGVLAFVRAEANRPRVWNLWTVNLATGKTVRITSHKVGQPWGAAWFPDGRRIAYSHEDRLIVRSLESGEQRVYRSPKKGRLIRTPAVSPDGRRIVFQLHKDGVWLLDLTQGSMVRILTDPTAEEFTWSPDGRRVAYHSRKTGDWGVWVMAAR